MSTPPNTPRTRGHRLQRIRTRVLRQAPLCAHCLAKGRITPAAELDHILALTNGGTDDEANLQGLCRPCHHLKTTQDLGQQYRAPIGADGWPLE